MSNPWWWNHPNVEIRSALWDEVQYADDYRDPETDIKANAEWWREHLYDTSDDWWENTNMYIPVALDAFEPGTSSEEFAWEALLRVRENPELLDDLDGRDLRYFEKTIRDQIESGSDGQIIGYGDMFYMGGGTYVIEPDDIETSLFDFLEANREALDPIDIQALASKRVGQTMTFGGGAAPLVTIQRIA